MGSKANGSSHWMLERATSIALVPLTFWFIYSILSFSGPAHVDFLVWLKNPTNAGILTVTILTAYHHAALGLHVIIDDYVSTPATNRFMNCAVTGAFLLMAIASIVSIITIVF